MNHSTRALGVLALTAVAALTGCAAQSAAGHSTSQTSGVAAHSTPGTPAPTTSTATTSTPRRTSATPIRPTTPAPHTSTAGTRSWLDHLDAKLAALAPNEPIEIVRVPGGYEAFTYDQETHVQFWKVLGHSDHWKLMGRSHYPPGQHAAWVHAQGGGRLLSDMRDPVYIMRGNFTGDSTGNTVAFANGPDGWGVLKKDKRGYLVPTGRPVGGPGDSGGLDRGLAYDMEFKHGRLVTYTCPTNLALAQCGDAPITTTWAWISPSFVSV